MTGLAAAAVVLLLIAGGVFAFAAGLGLVRMPDVYVRMHASTKAGTLGTGLILVGVAVYFGDMGVAARAAAVAVFLMLTAPVGAHLIGRAAYRAGVPLWKDSVVDELEDSRAAAGQPPRADAG